MRIHGVSISGSETRFPEPRFHYKSEPRFSLKNSVQPEFIIHGRLNTTFHKQSKTTVMKIEFIYS